jgi:putative FmdB family regulatory protein
MPIYEYLCRRCDKKVEKIQKSVAEEVECPQCGHLAERVVSTFSAKASAGSAGGGCAPAGGFG